MSGYKVPYSMRGCLIAEDDFRIVNEVMKEECLSGQGPYTKKFEAAFAEYCKSPYAYTCNNGTVALDIAAQALGIGPGDEVLTSAISFVATGMAPLRFGADVRFVDIDPRTFNMDPSKIEEKITDKTKAIFLVHLCGQMCDMDPIMSIAGKYGLKVVEDAAHAPGAAYKGRKAGTIGDIGTFSFHTWKNMTTLGEGGMITCKDGGTAEKVSLLKQFGAVHFDREVWDCADGDLPFYLDFKRVGQYYGNNSRMSDVQAAMGITQLSKLDEANKRRRDYANILNEGLKDNEFVTVPYNSPDCYHVYHIYNIKFESEKLGVDKDALLRPLLEEYGIQCWIQYVPVYLFSIFREKGHMPGECPQAEKVFRKNLISLPIGPTMTKEMAEYTVDSIQKVIKKIKNKR
jgi:perosamine synthetase